MENANTEDILVLPPANLPSYVIPLIYSTIARFLVQKYQGAGIRAHIGAGGQLYSFWRAVLISLIGLVVIVALLLALSFMTDILPIIHA